MRGAIAAGVSPRPPLFFPDGHPETPPTPAFCCSEHLSRWDLCVSRGDPVELRQGQDGVARLQHSLHLWGPFALLCGPVERPSEPWLRCS